ncbi:tachykinin precursor 4 [Phyllostomus discolor]|uniref:Tachykinin 4 n=1 Tax=Phyllostomus discolor TaxID=89673 RepID=A0A833ZIH4_9CHIR|nr:tachykinin precursor 4 [Phyllostomus discolor]
MLLCRALLLLLGLSACAVAGDEEPALSGTEARSWLTVTLEEDVIPSVQLQLQEVQRGRVSQFFGLMGKRVGEREGRKRERERERNINVQLLGAMACNPAGHQRGQMGQDLPGRRGPSTEGREGEERRLE